MDRITVERVWVTPAMAQGWLNKVPEVQRELKAQGISPLVRLMMETARLDSSDLIGFDINDKLISNQYRLWAIINSGIACWCSISRGHPLDCVFHDHLAEVEQALEKAESLGWRDCAVRRSGSLIFENVTLAS